MTNDERATIEAALKEARKNNILAISGRPQLKRKAVHRLLGRCRRSYLNHGKSPVGMLKIEAEFGTPAEADAATEILKEIGLRRELAS